MSTLRLSAIYVDLNRLLSPIIRDNLGLNVIPMTECWTFSHICNWQIYNKKHPYRRNSGDGFDPIYPVEHEQSLYFGSGSFSVPKGDVWDLDDLDKIELRVVCELSEWVPAYQHFWIVKVWAKYPNGEITKHCFKKFSFGDEVEIFGQPIRNLPPKRIPFK